MPKSRGQGTGHKEGRKEGRASPMVNHLSRTKHSCLPRQALLFHPPPNIFSVLIISRFVYSVLLLLQRGKTKDIMFYFLFCLLYKM